MDRRPADAVRVASEGGVLAAGAVVAASWASAQFPGTEGAGVLAASVVGGFGAWAAGVARNVGVGSSNLVLRAILGVRE